jgi:hypothetical protein
LRQNQGAVLPHKAYFKGVIMGDKPIVFENWEQVLQAEVPPDCQSAWRTAIVKFRYWLRETGKAPVDAAFKEHLEWKESYLPPEPYEVRRQESDEQAGVPVPHVRQTLLSVYSN